jgi:ribonuclease J
VLVDGLSVGDVGSIVLRDRKHLADDGVIIVNLAVDRITREIVAGPEVVSRGFVYVKESEELMREIEGVVIDAIDRCYYNNVRDYNTLKTKIKDGVSKHLLVKSKRTPMVLPIILEV